MVKISSLNPIGGHLSTLICLWAKNIRFAFHDKATSWLNGNAATNHNSLAWKWFYQEIRSDRSKLWTKPCKSSPIIRKRIWNKLSTSWSTYNHFMFIILFSSIIFPSLQITYNCKKYVIFLFIWIEIVEIWFTTVFFFGINQYLLIRITDIE